MKKGIVLNLLFILIVSVLSASEVRLWKISSSEELQKGKLKGVSLLGSGGITLSPKVTPWGDKHGQRNSHAIYWSQVVDSSGNVYIGSGNEGILFKITKDGKKSVFFEAKEYEITTLAIDEDDNIFAGTSPKGSIYKIKKDGRSNVFAELDERYIWDLAIDSSGNLFAATGERGLIFKISQEGDYDIFFNSTEPHIVSLGFDSSGNLLAGSDGSGILYEISSSGKAEVLFASGMREISSISSDRDGAIYFSALSDLKKDRKPPPLELKLQELMSAADLEKRAAESTIEQPPEKKFKAHLEGFPSPDEKELYKEPQATIFRLSPDGEVEKYLQFSHEKIYSIYTARDGSLLVGTGEPAKLYRLEAKNQTTLLYCLEESQITAILPLRHSGWSLLTSNPGRAYKVSSELESSGSFVSPPLDTKMRSDWGTISGHMEATAGASIELFTRSGNSPHPNSDWSSWSGPYDPSSPATVQSPSARFIQWKAALTRIGSSETPVLKNVSISYLQRNRPPEITSLSLIDPGKSMPLSPHMNGSKSSKEKKRTVEKGEKGVFWLAADPNGDKLLFTLSYKSEQGKEWKKIEQLDSQSSFLWNHSDIPDGSYIVRLLADDSPSNYVGEEKSAEALSEPFLIDHTPPRITWEKEVSGSLTLIKVQTEDLLGKISKLLYSTDQKKWYSLKPADSICDSSAEKFEFKAGIKVSDSLFLKCLDDSLNETVIEVK